LFSNGLKGDFALVDIPGHLADNTYPIETLLSATDYYGEVYQRGVICLLDKNNPKNDNGVIPWHKPGPTTPSQEQLDHLIHHYLIDAHRTAKFIQRKDFWRARQACNETLARHLLRLAEWHARASHGPQVDTWYEGRFIETWADQRFIQELPDLFCGSDSEQISHALEKSIQSFEWLSRETAAVIHLDFPDGAVAQSLRLIFEIISAQE
jgi:aminoglycoside 6-adenylyltransferase